MLSRIAESVYWMSRSLERTDNTARLLDINLTHLLEADEPSGEEVQWAPLLHIVAGNGPTSASFRTVLSPGPG